MKRISILTALLAALAFCVMPSGARAQLQIAGDLLVSLDANDLATQTMVGDPASTQSVWVNHGTAGLGDFVTTQTSVYATVGQFDNTRGVYFNARSKGFVCEDACPTDIQGNRRWSVEIWVWHVDRSLDNYGEAPVSWGDRPTNVCEMNIGGNNDANLLVTYGGNGDWGWGGNSRRPGLAAWHHIVWVHDSMDDGATTDSLACYVDGVQNTTMTGYGNRDTSGTMLGVTLDTHDLNNTFVTNTAGVDSPKCPLSVGNTRGWTGSNGTWNAAYASTPNFALGKVRIMTGALTREQVKNNYDEEKAEYGPKANPPLPLLEWRKPLAGAAQGKVMEFGDGTTTITKPFQYTNLSGAPVTVSSYAIVGPDAALYKLIPTTPTLGTISVDQFVSFNVDYTPTSTAETSATLVVETTLGQQRIWLRGNVVRTYVSTAGSDTTGNGTQANPYATLRKAIDSAKPGDVIEMADGDYGDGVLGVSGAGATDGDRQVRIVSPTGNATITNNTNTDGRFRSNMIGAVVAPGEIVYPAPNPLGIKNTTLVLQNLTLNFSGNSGNPLRLSGTGTFDLTLEGCKVYNKGGEYAIGADDNLSRYLRITLKNSTIYGGNVLANDAFIPPIPAERHPAVLANGGLVELTATDCDFRQSYVGIEFSSRITPGTIDLTRCQFGTDATGYFGPLSTGQSYIGVDLANTLGDGSLSPGNGTVATLTDCKFNGVSYRAFQSPGFSTTLIASRCVFNDAQSRGIIITGTAPYTGGASTISDCTFNNPDAYRDVDLMAAEGVPTFTFNNCKFTTVPPGSRRDSTLAIGNPNNTGFGMTMYVNNCWLECGTNPTSLVGGAGVNPAAIMNLAPVAVSLYVDRCTLLSRNRVDFVGPTGSTLTRPSVINFRADRTAGGTTRNVLYITNSVLEGSTIAIAMPGSDDGSRLIGTGRIVNNTIVASSDADTSFALVATSPDAVRNDDVRMRNNIILGYGDVTFTNQAGITLENNWTLADGDPVFVSPNPFVLPADGTIGLPNFALTALTPAGAYPTGIIGGATNYIDFFGTNDILGVDRSAIGRYDIGAYEYNPPPNAARWWSMF